MTEYPIEGIGGPSSTGSLQAGPPYIFGQYLSPGVDEEAEGDIVEPFVHVQYGADGVLCQVPFSADVDGKRSIFGLRGPSSVFAGFVAVARRAALGGEDRGSPCESRRLQNVAVYSFRHQ